MKEKITQTVKGLKVSLDQLIYQYSESNLSKGKPHAFIYFLTVRNLSDRRVQLLGRKWVLKGKSGKILIFEGNEIVGKIPTLKPGDHFSYNSYHIVSEYTEARGAIYGIDEFRNAIHVSVPYFEMKIPEARNN